MTTAHYSSEPRSVTEARRMVTAALGDMDGEIVELAALAVSELAANVVRHAQTRFSVTVETTADVVRVEVADRGAGRPVVQHPGPRTPTGRGLAIVDRITDDWGVDALTGGGHRVWFELRRRHRAATASSRPVS